MFLPNRLRFDRIMTSVECDGTESSIFNCPFTGFGDYTDWAVGIACANACDEDYEIRPTYLIEDK